MQREEIREKILLIIQKIMDSTNIQIDMPIRDMAFDSLRFIKLVLQIEKTFNIKFEDEFLLLHNYETIMDICDYVENRLNVVAVE